MLTPPRSLLVRFTALSLICFVALGIGLNALLEREIEGRVVAHDAEAVIYLAGLLRQEVARGELGFETAGRARAVAARFLRYNHLGPEYEAVRVWDARLRLVTGRRRADDGLPNAVRLRRTALAGRLIADRDGARARLHYLVPLRPAAGGPPLGVLDVTQRSAPLEAGIAELTRPVTFAVAGGLGLLWIALFPIVFRASRRLRIQASHAQALALTDQLTGLANRRALERELDQTRSPAGLVLIDLDDFKAINTANGLALGDELLRTTAARLRSVARRGEVVARLGGDEFAVLVREATSVETERAAERFGAALCEADLDTGPLAASLGFASMPEDTVDPAALLRHAGAALADAKRTGGQTLRRYRPEHEHAARGLGAQRVEVQSLLEHPELIRIVTQPVARLEDGTVVAFEALTRIDAEPPRGPGEWFAQARRVGLGVQLEAEALRAALALTGRPPGTRLSVNLSPRALCSRLVHDVLPSDLSGLVIEVTEHDLAAAVPGLAGSLAVMRERGALIAIDDAGAGYAGLKQTMILQPDVIKLDRELVTDLHEDLAKVALVEALVSYARQTGASLCAEGIETLEELRALTALEVTAGQGFVLAAPATGWPTVDGDAAAACGEAARPRGAAAGSGLLAAPRRSP